MAEAAFAAQSTLENALAVSGESLDAALSAREATAAASTDGTLGNDNNNATANAVVPPAAAAATPANTTSGVAAVAAAGRRLLEEEEEEGYEEPMLKHVINGALPASRLAYMLAAALLAG